MKADTQIENKALDKVNLFIQSNLRVLLTFIFIGVIFLPISDIRRNNLIILIEESGLTWVKGVDRTKGINSLFENIISSSNLMISKGINRFLLIFQNILDFYIGLISIDFDIIRKTGFLFTFIYLLIPILIAYFIFIIIQGIKTGKHNSNFLRFISPYKLIILLLLIPVTQDTVWLGSIIAIVLLIYWYFNDLQNKRSEYKNISILEIVSWKKSIFLIFSVIYFWLPILSLFGSSNYSLTTFLSINSNSLLIGIIVLLGILFCLWIVFQSRITNKSLLDIVKTKYEETISLKNFILYITVFLFIFSFLEINVFQNPASSLIYFVINFPWIFILVIHDPSDFFLSIINIITFSFDLIIDSSRVIFNLIIPPSPTEVSILGVIQSTLWISLLIFVWILFLYLIYLVKYDSVSNSKVNKLHRSKSYLIYANTIIFSLLGLILLKTIFDPSLKLKPESMAQWMRISLVLLLIVVVITFFLIVISEYIASWNYFNKFKSNFVNILIFTAIFAFVFIFTSENYLLVFNDLFEIQTDFFASILFFGIAFIILLILVFVLYWSVTQVKSGRSWKIITNTVIINITAVFLALIMITPFIWMLKNSLQTNSQNTTDFLQQGLIPDPFTTKNYAQLFGIVDPAYATLDYRVITWLFNSFVTAVFVTMFLVFFSAMAGYVLAKREFIGRKLLFTLIIAIMMVPPYVQVIPLFLELQKLGFRGSLLGVILPFLIQPFSIFLATEFMKGIPEDYLDAARVDGYSEFEIFRKIVLPLSIPVISVMIIINLIANWNSFLWPLLLLEGVDVSPQIRTLPLGIYLINGQLEEQIGVILALATLIVIPIFIILFLAQDYIKKGVTIEGLKG